MKKMTVIISAMLALFLLTAAGIAVISSYGTITGYATVSKSIAIDIIGSSNDTYYSVSAHQGETVYSPKIKLVNSMSDDIDVIINVTTDHPSDVKVSIVDETKNETLSNPVNVPSDDLYFYVKEEFDAGAAIGNYTFTIDILPA